MNRNKAETVHHFIDLLLTGKKHKKKPVKSSFFFGKVQEKPGLLQSQKQQDVKSSAQTATKTAT